MKQFIIFFVLLYVFSFSVGAEEYSFSGEELQSADIEEEYRAFVEELPAEVGDEFSSTSLEKFDFQYFIGFVKESFEKAFSPAVKVLCTLAGMVIITSVFNMYKLTFKSERTSAAYEFCSKLCFAIALWKVERGVLETVSVFLETMCNTMLAIVPTMEAICIYGGNITSSAVTATGVNLMISLCTLLFSKILTPAVTLSYLLSVTASVTKNAGISFMSKTLRGIVMSVVGAVAALSAFILGMQCSVSQSTDSLAGHTVRYAIGSYVPIVGGSVSESFSIISQSFSVIKNLCGMGGIVVIILLFLPPFVSLALNRFSIGIASGTAGMLGSEPEGEMLSEAGGTVTLLMGICVACASMFVIALGIFAKTPTAYGS